MCKALTHDRTPRLSTLSTVVVALLLLLPSLSAALSLRAAGAWRGGEPWANITVSWRDVVEGGDDDWVGAFLQGYNATYVRYVNVGGGSSATFRLLSARHAYVFRYFRGDDLLAESNLVQPRGDVPNQGHLSFVPDGDLRASGETGGVMKLTWTSNASDPGTVRYGKSSGALDVTAVAVVDTYEATDFTNCMGIPPVPPRGEPFANLGARAIRCGFSCYDDPTSSEMFLDPGFLHTATLRDLVPGRRYFYDFGIRDAGGGDGDPRRSPVYSFVAPRAAGGDDGHDEGDDDSADADKDSASPQSSSFTFLVTADMGIGAVYPGQEGSAMDNDPNHEHPGFPDGIGNGADNVVRGILADPLTATDEFLLVNGDISYARGWPWIWELFFDLVQPLATRMPLMVGVGNHEVDSHENPFVETSGGDSGGECGVAAAKRFPAHLASPTKMWYSFTHGSVHVVQLSTEHPVKEQVEFFKADMAALDRDRVPWVIVSLHRPIFISESVASAELQHILVSNWHPLFVESGVDFVYTGHAHYYERLCAVDVPDMSNTTDLRCSGSAGTAGSAERDRPVYIVDGSAGAEPDMSSPDSPLTEYKEFAKWGYSRMFVNGSRSLELRHYAAKIAPDGKGVELPFAVTDVVRLEGL